MLLDVYTQPRFTTINLRVYFYRFLQNGNTRVLISGSNHSRSTTLSRDDDTTDTDSDNDMAISRTPTARKSTGQRGLNRRSFESENDGEAEGTRRFFGPEGTYIIDAKQTGNLGRYLNHSCTPNLMVQNVFIDTHDLRFPWVAFFASRCGSVLCKFFSNWVKRRSSKVILTKTTFKIFYI